MSVFAIGDLHLSGNCNKPMDVFGLHWENHFEQIQQSWCSKVGNEDIVLIPGDISWAMQLEDAVADLEAIGALPGRKVLLKGNHDYWWSSIAKVRACLPPNMYAIQNDALCLDEYVFCGTRGWSLPTDQNPLSPQDNKIYQREVLRLQLSLENAVPLLHGKSLVVLLHFPPLLADGTETEFTYLLEQYPVEAVVYGHLHGAGISAGFCGKRNGIVYQLVSCDALHFELQEVMNERQI